MSNKELTEEKIKALKRAALPSIEQQKAAVEEIESLLSQGVDPEVALQSVFAMPTKNKQ